jgi:hypothetical protein
MARHRVFRNYLNARREAEAWEIAHRLYEERVEVAKERADRAAQQAEEERLARRKQLEDATAQQQSECNTVDEVFVPDSDGESVMAEETVLSEETGQERDVREQDVSASSSPVSRDQAGRETASPIKPTLEQLVKIAKWQQRAREADARLKEARGRRQDALSWYDRRIEDEESQRLKETPVPDLYSKRRLEDAYHEFVGAVRTFDEAFQREMPYAERLLKGGWLYRVVTWILRQPVLDSNISLARSSR